MRQNLTAMKPYPLKSLSIALLAFSPAFLHAESIHIAQSANTSDASPPSSTAAVQSSPNSIPSVPGVQAVPREPEARSLIGRTVFGSDEKELGHLKDLVVALNSGAIVFGVVSTGEGDRAVPFSEFETRLGEQGLHLKLNADSKTLNDAPRFEKARLGEFRSGEPLREKAYQPFDRQPPATVANEQLVLVSDLANTPLVRNGQPLGRIEDVLVHLETRIAQLLVNVEGNNNTPSTMFTLPLYGITITKDNEINTTFTADQFTSVPTATGNAPTLIANASSATLMWSAYGNSAKLDAAPRSSPAFQDRPIAARPPVDEIRNALAADPHTRSEQVRVVAAPNRVVLQGVVSDEDDRRRVENRVSEAAGGWTIDNQIRVASADSE